MKKFHDFNIFKYEINCEKRELTLNLRGRSGTKNGVIVFERLIGHHFEHVLDSNIVLEFEEYNADEFYQGFYKEIQVYQRHGLPIKTKSAEIFADEAFKRSLKFIVISSSHGLSGWVICENVSVS